jgi:hypothetical protein
MSNPSHWLKRHSLLAGIALIFLLTWPIDLANAGLLPLEVPDPAALTFGWGISVAALIMTGLTLGREGVVALLKRFLLWRVKWTWYFINTGGSLLLAAILHAAGNTAGVFLPMANTLSGANLDVYIMAVAFLILIAIPITDRAGLARPEQAKLTEPQN